MKLRLRYHALAMAALICTSFVIWLVDGQFRAQEFSYIFGLFIGYFMATVNFGYFGGE